MRVIEVQDMSAQAPHFEVTISEYGWFATGAGKSERQAIRRAKRKMKIALALRRDLSFARRTR